MSARSNGGASTKVPLGFGGLTASIGDHIAHFYRGTDQKFDVLGPCIAEGISVFYTPARKMRINYANGSHLKVSMLLEHALLGSSSCIGAKRLETLC